MGRGWRLAGETKKPWVTNADCGIWGTRHRGPRSRHTTLAHPLGQAWTQAWSFPTPSVGSKSTRATLHPQPDSLCSCKGILGRTQNPSSSQLGAARPPMPGGEGPRPVLRPQAGKCTLSPCKAHKGGAGTSFSKHLQAQTPQGSRQLLQKHMLLVLGLAMLPL